MDIVTLGQAKEQLERLIEVANAEKKQYRITSDVGSVVVLPEETYNNLLVTLELLSTPGIMDNIRERQEEFFVCDSAEVEARFP